MATVFTAQIFYDDGGSLLLGLFTTPEKAETEIHKFYSLAEMRPSPAALSSLGRWYWQNELATISAVIQEMEIQ